MKYTLIECANCGAKVEKPSKEINRQKKKGRTNFYCSQSCAAKQSWEHLKEYHGKYNDNLLVGRTDEYTGLREHIRRAKKRSKDVDIDLEYLKEIWELQGGRCKYTNVELNHPTSSVSEKNYNYMASLDRIDSSKGYIKGNIQFVSVSVNWLKNSMDNDHIQEFFNIVSGVKQDRRML